MVKKKSQLTVLIFLSDIFFPQQQKLYFNL